MPVHLLRGGGEQHSEDYRGVNPLGQVPTLVIDGTVLTVGWSNLKICAHRADPDPERGDHGVPARHAPGGGAAAGQPGGQGQGQDGHGDHLQRHAASSGIKFVTSVGNAKPG